MILRPPNKAINASRAGSTNQKLVESTTMSAAADIGSFATFAIIVVWFGWWFVRQWKSAMDAAVESFIRPTSNTTLQCVVPEVPVSSTSGPALRSSNAANTTIENVIAGTSADTHSNYLSSNDDSSPTPLKQHKDIAGIRKPRGLQLLHNSTEGNAHTEKALAFILQLEQSEENNAENGDSDNDSDNDENGDGLSSRSNREASVVHESALLDKQSSNATAPAPAVTCVRVVDDELAMLPYSSTRYGRTSTMETKEEETGKSGDHIDAIVSAIVDELCTLVSKPMSMQKLGRERRASHNQ
ncbi:hypothetical protein IWW48_005261 [Coemansia sp. RSA 1200]|nr:hypothetical protein IWW48_005261 [Coemansia sp. RSA 1200]